MSILRDPVSLFISVWDYYDLPKRLGKGGKRTSLQQFAMMKDKPNNIGTVTNLTNFWFIQKFYVIFWLIGGRGATRILNFGAKIYMRALSLLKPARVLQLTDCGQLM